MNTNQTTPHGGSKPADVYFFGTCLLDLFMPEAGMDAITLLEQQGIKVHFPMEQSCCGQPAFSSGHREEAFDVAKAQLDLFHRRAFRLLRRHDEAPLAQIVQRQRI